MKRKTLLLAAALTVAAAGALGVAGVPHAGATTIPHTNAPDAPNANANAASISGANAANVPGANTANASSAELANIPGAKLANVRGAKLANVRGVNAANVPGGNTASAGDANAAVAIDVNAAAELDPSLPPGGNFNLSIWQLQLPTGSPGKPDTIPPSQLEGASGYSNPAYFWTDKTDGSMTFWAPEKGVTTPNSSYARSELREMNTNGSAADWTLAGNHTMSAELRIPQVTKNVCVGQVHLGSGGSSTKPLLELYYRPNGDIYLGTENSPDGGQTLHWVGNVPLGAHWTYVINVTGNKINLTVNGSKTTYTIPSSFNPYKQYFKAGSYNQSSSDSTSNGAKVKFYSLTVTHS